MAIEPLYPLPAFLQGRKSIQQYRKWLDRKAKAHALRDRKRGDHQITIADYKRLMHAAMIASEGNDFYTGEPLEWEKLSTYSNVASQADRASYKAGFARLPTDDHVMGN